MKLDKFIKKHADSISINIFSEVLNNKDIIEACRNIKEKDIANIATLEKFIDLAWEHSERFNISNSLFLDNYNKNYSDDELFVNIKKLCSKGVASIGYIPPKDFFLNELERDIEIISKARRKRVKIFIILDDYIFNNIQFVKSVLKLVLSKEEIDGIKISSGLRKEKGNSFNINIILDSIKSSKRKDFKLATCLNLFDDNGFLESENVLRLADVVLGESWAKQNLYFIYDYDELKLQGIFN